MSSKGLGSEVGAYRTTGLKEKKSENRQSIKWQYGSPNSKRVVLSHGESQLVIKRWVMLSPTVVTRGLVLHMPGDSECSR